MSAVANKFNRLKDAPWFTNGETEVIVGGAGGISSWLSLFLVRAGFAVNVFDFDRYEEHNMGGQLCRAKDMGLHKTVALQLTITEFCGTTAPITGYAEKYDKDSFTHKYVFAGFDNIEARRIMFHKWRAENEGDAQAIYIDGRLQPEALEIFCITGDQKEKMDAYEQEHLFPDSDVAEAPCTFKQTTHAAAMIASHMCGFFTNHIANVKMNAGRIIPYQWQYYLPLDMLDN